jgi:hypothetical protein
VQFALDDLASNHSLSFDPDGVTATSYSCAATTVVGRGPGSDLEPRADAEPAVDPDAAATESASTAPVATQLVDLPSNTVAEACAAEPSAPATRYTWRELGVDQAAVDAYFAPPRLFVSSDGVGFRELPHPATTSTGTRATSNQVFALGGGFAMLTTETAYDGASQRQRLFVSADGLAWTERLMPWDSAWSYVSDVGRTSDGSLVVVATVPTMTGSSPRVATSTDDGATWRNVALAGLLNDADGASATLQTYDVDIGALGVTVVGSIAIDPFVENGPVSVTIGDVVVSMLDQMGTIEFTDVSSGELLGRLGADQGYDVDGTPIESDSVNATRDPMTGSPILLAADGSERLRPTNDELEPMYRAANERSNRLVVLHSEDGVSWSRDDIDAIAGLSASMYGGFVTMPSQLLVTVTSTETLNTMAKPTTYVLVATPKG